MKTLKLLALAAFTLLFSQCKTTAPTAPSGPAPSLLEAKNILDTTQSIFLQFADSTNGNPEQAIDLTTGWLLSQPNVQDAYSIDSTYITIILKSGLQTGFHFDLVDDSGYSIFRGGGSAKSSVKPIVTVSGTHSKNTITNKKVLVFASGYDELLGVKTQLPQTVKRLTNSGLGLDITVLKNEQCSYDVVKTFGDYGLVLIDGHGHEDGFKLGGRLDGLEGSNVLTEELMKSFVNSTFGSQTYDQLITGILQLNIANYVNIKRPKWWKGKNVSSLGVYCTSKGMDILPPMPNTIILGNFCYSGGTNATIVVPARNGNPSRTVTFQGNIGQAFIDKNLISYYGYAFDIGVSTTVTDEFAAEMEDSIVKRFVEDLDSTGIANLRPADGAEYFDTYKGAESHGGHQYFLFFKHFGADDYSYDKGCVTQFTDARDGHVYKAVCIGKQNWMAENLNYDVPGSLYSDSSQPNRDTYGRFYFWNDMMDGSGASNANPSGVQGICPKGWHVPSAAEWNQLVTFVGGSSVAGKALKSTSSLWLWADVSGMTHPGGGSNSSGFSALPGGWITTDFANPGGFIGGQFNFNAAFHTASELHPNVIDGIQMLGGQDSTEWFTFYTDQHLHDSKRVSALPCRCVKDP